MLETPVPRDACCRCHHRNESSLTAILLFKYTEEFKVGVG
jgi:hypothetical protein